MADLDALEPRVLFVWLITTPTGSEPSTTTTATTLSAIPDGAAFGTSGTARRHRCGRRLCGLGSWGRTSAGLQAVRPLVILTGTSAVLIPRTARSATTDFAGFLERSARWARHRVSDLWGDDWGGGGYACN